MIKNVLKGMLIGIANIIPGVSGGTMAVSMGIYDRLISCISHPFKDFKNNVLFLIPIALGMGLAIVASAFGIDYLFETFPLQTNLLFIGLILGSLPAIYKKVKSATMRLGHIAAAIFFFSLVVGMAMLNGANGNYVQLEVTFIALVKLFLIGVLASATMVIPGVSGSMVLLLLGYYNPILASINDFIRARTDFDVPAMLNEFGVLFPFGIGVIVGVLVIAKIIEYIFEKFPLYAYWAIIGLIVASPIAIIAMGTFPVLTVINVGTGIVALALGIFVAMKLGE